MHDVGKNPVWNDDTFYLQFSSLDQIVDLHVHESDITWDDTFGKTTFTVGDLLNQDVFNLTSGDTYAGSVTLSTTFDYDQTNSTTLL